MLNQLEPPEDTPPERAAGPTISDMVALLDRLSTHVMVHVDNPRLEEIRAVVESQPLCKVVTSPHLPDVTQVFILRPLADALTRSKT